MKRDPVVRRAAELEVTEAALWYEERRHGLGSRFLEAVDSAFAAITERPDAWPLWQPRRSYRKYVLSGFPFVVFYTWDGSAVVIVAVAHTHREPAYWLSREPR